MAFPSDNGFANVP